MNLNPKNPIIFQKEDRSTWKFVWMSVADAFIFLNYWNEFVNERMGFFARFPCFANKCQINSWLEGSNFTPLSKSGHW
jgi:hypothetical protein